MTLSSTPRFTEHQRELLGLNFELCDPLSGDLRGIVPERLNSQVIFLVSNLNDWLIREQQSQLIRAVADRSTCLVTPILDTEEPIEARTFQMFHDLPKDLPVRGLSTTFEEYSDSDMVRYADLQYKQRQKSIDFLRKYENLTERCARVFSRFFSAGEIVIKDNEIRAPQHVIAALAEAQRFSDDPELMEAKRKLLEADDKLESFSAELGIESDDLRGDFLLFQQEGRVSKFETVLPELVQEYGKVIVLCDEELVVGNFDLIRTIEKLGITHVTIVPRRGVEERWKQESRAGIRDMQMVELEVRNESGVKECPPINNCRFIVPKQFLSHYPDQVCALFELTDDASVTLFHQNMFRSSSPRKFGAGETLRVTGLDSRTVTDFIKLQLASESNNSSEIAGKMMQTVFNRNLLFCGMAIERPFFTCDFWLEFVEHSWVMKISSAEEFTFNVTNNHFAIDAEYLLYRMKMQPHEYYFLSSGRTIEFVDIEADSLSAMREKLSGFAGDKFLKISGEYTVNSAKHYQITATTDVRFILCDTDESSKKRKTPPLEEGSDSANSEQASN